MYDHENLAAIVFFLWCVVKDNACARTPITIIEMVELIKYVCHEIDTDNDKHLCRDLCRTDYSRIQKCVNTRDAS